MQIHLKQKEIEAALKLFVAQQGISLTGKTLTVAFTAGRKDTGLSAELTIEDAVQDSTNTFAIPVVQATVEPEKETNEPVAEEVVTKVTSLFN